MPQLGTIYRYFRADADHDISADLFELSLDEVTWETASVTYVAPADWPPSVIAANSGQPPKTGFVGYWWRTLTGPGTAFPTISSGMTFYGRLTDTPEHPHFLWKVSVPKGT